MGVILTCVKSTHPRARRAVRTMSMREASLSENQLHRRGSVCAHALQGSSSLEHLMQVNNRRGAKHFFFEIN
jgi:hypothetical protein